MPEVKIAFLLLVHKDPEAIVEQAEALSAHGDCVAIHADARMPPAAFRRLAEALAGNRRVTLAKRVRCGWGEWSLVEGTLNLIRAARAAFEGITHYHLLSGDCYPIKSRSYFERELAAKDADIIECADFHTSGWIKTGLSEERLIYRHWFNERERPWLFYRSMALQKRLGLRRAPPEGLQMRIGSQWWCLRAGTVEAVLAFMRRRRDVVRFFRTTWIPDETFFQTLVAHLVPPGQIRAHPPTYLIFSDYGMPVVFQNDHYEFLRGRSRFFARKLSVSARELRRRLLGDFRAWESERPEGGADGDLYGYLARRGRHGERYAPRFWQRAITIAEDRHMLVVAAKLWHTGRAAERAIAEVMNLPRLGYLFDDGEDLDLDLGNLESGLDKRGRHRRAFMNLVFDAMRTRQVLFCVDPGRTDVIDDLVTTAGNLRVLLIEAEVPDSHLADHARRAGLLSDVSGSYERVEVMKALRHQFDGEVATLRRRYRDILFRHATGRTRGENTLEIGHFLHVPRIPAEAIARAIEQQS